MGGSLLPVLVVVLSARSAVGEPAGSAHVDGAPPSKIGKKRVKKSDLPLILANVSLHGEDEANDSVNER